MDPQPLVAAIQDAMTSNAVTAIITSRPEPQTWLLRDNKLLWILGGAVVGFYFGFRYGVVSGRSVFED